MTAIEHKELKGITVRNLVVTIISTASIVASVMTTYFQLKDDIHDVRLKQETQSRIDEIRLKVLEDEVDVLDQQVDELKSRRTVTEQKNYSAINNSLNH
jgi:hypothetical protein